MTALRPLPAPKPETETFWRGCKDLLAVEALNGGSKKGEDARVAELS